MYLRTSSTGFLRCLFLFFAGVAALGQSIIPAPEEGQKIAISWVRLVCAHRYEPWAIQWQNTAKVYFECDPDLVSDGFEFKPFVVVSTNRYRYVHREPFATETEAREDLKIRLEMDPMANIYRVEKLEINPPRDPTLLQPADSGSLLFQVEPR
jgi:hypothetical protein